MFLLLSEDLIFCIFIKDYFCSNISYVCFLDEIFMTLLRLTTFYIRRNFFLTQNILNKKQKNYYELLGSRFKIKLENILTDMLKNPSFHYNSILNLN